MVDSMQDIDGDMAPARPLEAWAPLFQTLAVCHDPDEAGSIAGQLARLLGLDYFSYVVSAVPAADDGRGDAGMLLSTYPADWQSRYRRRSYEMEDPVIVLGRHERLPFSWGDDGYLKRIPPSSRRLFFEARDFGISNGFTIPMHGPYGECALFSVAGREPPTHLRDLAGADFQALLVIANCLHTTMLGRRMALAKDSSVKLSEHERICLVWTSRGKTAWEIAQIIGRSKATVDFHIRRATGKLDATNKVHAAFRALQLDLL